MGDANFSYAFIYGGKATTVTISGNTFDVTGNANFYQTFYYSNVVELPAEMFNCPNTSSFEKTFMYSKVETVSSDLFKNCPNVSNFRQTFDSSKIKEVPVGLFANNVGVTSPDAYYNTFFNCFELEKACVDSKFVGERMFLNNQKLQRIEITDNVISIEPSGFEVYLADLPTILKTNNPIALSYDWKTARRVLVTKEPSDMTVDELNAVTFEVDTTESYAPMNFQWYEVKDGNETLLTEDKSKFYKSSIEGQANATTSSTIVIKAKKEGKLSFEYMVSSELNGDIFNISVTDKNGTTTVANNISGEVDWTAYNGEYTPNAEGEIIITLTYAKNASVDAGLDYGAIRDIEYYIDTYSEFNFENDDIYTIITPDTSVSSYSEYGWVVDTLDGETVFRSDNIGVDSSYATASIRFYAEEEATVSYDYLVSSEVSNDRFSTSIRTHNSSRSGVSANGEKDWQNYSVVFTPSKENYLEVTLSYYKNSSISSNKDIAAIKNLRVTSFEIDNCTFENDSVFTINGSQWEVKNSYEGVNSKVLTVPADAVTLNKNGYQYYCNISNESRSATIDTNKATLTVEPGEEIIDPILYSSLITKWTIPVDADGAGVGTTILLPIPAHVNNNYKVDWGDGSAIQTFDSTANFPNHTYTNTSEKTYTIKVGGKVNQFGYTGTTEISEANGNKEYETFTKYLTGLVDWGELDIKQYGFSRCTNLTGSIPVPELTARSFKNVTNMANLFYMCTGLNIEIPANLFATATKVTSFADTFSGCANLTGTIPANLFAENAFVTNFSNTFNGCKKLTGMIPAKLFTVKPFVTTYEGMFEGCEGLTAGEIAIDKDEAVNMDRMFKDCTALESLVFGQFNKHLNGAAMFEGASSLRAVIMLNQALSQGEVGVANDLATLGLRDEAMIYVPYKSNEAVYEQAWSNIDADRIEEIVKGNEPNPDYVNVNGTYVDKTGYSVAGFGMNETEKYTQYGFRVEVSGIPVDTSETGSEWIIYTLYKN